MDFAKAEITAIDQIDFSLPKDPVFNQQVLNGNRKVDAKVYVGCSKWGRAEWVGRIYPKGAREKNFLDHYVKYFNGIELNATHYKIIGPAGIIKWADKAGEKDFKFCPKMYQAITHKRKLSEKAFLTNEFLRGIIAFEQHLGPVLVQFSETFGPKRKEELFEFLKTLKPGIPYALELRHKAWFAGDMREELFGKLTELNIGSVITDVSARRDCAHMYLPTPVAFIRFVGNDLHPTDYARVDEWVERIKHWLDNGLQELYFFVHMNDETFTPDLVSDLVKKLNQSCGLKLSLPVFI